MTMMTKMMEIEHGATATGTTETREPRDQEKSSKSQIVIVDLDEPKRPGWLAAFAREGGSC